MHVPRRANGMTVWEWLAILAVAGVFGSVLVAGAKRAPMVDVARSMKNELEEIDRVIREAEAAGRQPGDGIWDPAEYLPLLKPKFSELKETGKDRFGNSYGPVRTGGRPEVPAATATRLRGIIDPVFWSPFREASPAPAADSPAAQPAAPTATPATPSPP